MTHWMLQAPEYTISGEVQEAFQRTLNARNPAFLPAEVPRWVFLHWLAQQGYLMHGSKRDDITLFEPRTPHDLGPDEFSKRTGVFAASDGLWPMMFALKDRTRSKRILSSAIQVREKGRWSPMKYFLSFGPIDPQETNGRALLSAGFVYVLHGKGFEQTPVYEWPGLGEVLEAQWVNPDPVVPLLCIPVSPDDFPLPVRVHDAEAVRARAKLDPWGFPWLCENEA